MSQYDLKFDHKINLGHSGLYFTVLCKKFDGKINVGLSDLYVKIESLPKLLMGIRDVAAFIIPYEQIQ